MWEPVKEKWIYVRDWVEHKREAMEKFEQYSQGHTAARETRRPLKTWVH
jgi:hypothetical protein